MNQQPKINPSVMISMLVIAVFFSMASRTIFSPLMPMLQKELGFSLSTAGTLFFLISVIYGVTMLFSGFLSARIGHGKAIVVALAAISLGLFLAAVSRGIVPLAMGMLLIGAGAGTYPTSGLVMINTTISLERRSTAFSFHEIGPNLALLVSPLIVLALEPWFGWRGVLIWLSAASFIGSMVFLRWGAPGSGLGAVPRFSTIGKILKLRTTILGMVIMSAALAGQQGVYAILPAYLVTEHGLSSRYVNILLSISRVTGIILLLRSGPVINRIGRRTTIFGVLFFSALCTALLGILQGIPLAAAVIAQPALLTVLFPAVLSSLSEIGDIRYQNITYAVIITIGVGGGVGVAPAILGVMGDLGIGWLGFILLAVYMTIAMIFLRVTPVFGCEQNREEK
ncbi:MFS transporter [Marispirochaeta sp.]|uniref:MFS transporter n=1 Tax=Marispirochaeta sp. TaxID=2038653 RepID=UPI0029C96B23|nr:MFS transporter [Marispirochaeta sp.]